MVKNEYQLSSRITQSNYDRLSRWYDWLAAGSERRAQAAGLELLRVKEGDTILEIGFGTGQALMVLARSVCSSGKVIGIDRSGGMISQAVVKLKKTALSKRTTLVCGDAIQLPFQSECCDAIFMSFTLELFQPTDILTVLSECWRVLRPGGRLCAVAMAETADPGLMSRVYGWANRRFPVWIDCRPIDVQNVVSQAGFQIQDKAEMGMWGLPIRIVMAKKAETRPTPSVFVGN